MGCAFLHKTLGTNSMRRSLALMVGCLLAGGGWSCTAMKTIHPTRQPTASPFASVQPGDRVLVETRDGRKSMVVVGTVSAGAIVSQGGERIEADDVVRVQRRGFSGARTAFLVGGIVAGVYIALMAVAAATLGGFL